MRRSLVVSLHDAAPATAEVSRRWLDLLESVGVRVSILVVPGPWMGRDMSGADGFVEWLDAAAARGHEIVQHGWCHSSVRGDVSYARRVVGNLLGRGCQEFWELSEQDASVHLTLGREALRSQGIDTTGFVAPGWLMSGGTVSALRSLGYRWTTTHTAVMPLDGEPIVMPVLSQRPGSRISGAVGVLTLNVARILMRGGVPFRVAVHPDDIRHRVLRGSVLEMCTGALGRGYESMTYGALVERTEEMPEAGSRTQ